MKAHRDVVVQAPVARAVTSDGWRHVRPDGSDLYDARYAWCGNFQNGRCAVREPDGAYLHLTREGVPAYDARWRYAGDLRDGTKRRPAAT